MKKIRVAYADKSTNQSPGDQTKRTYDGIDPRQMGPGELAVNDLRIANGSGSFDYVIHCTKKSIIDDVIKDFLTIINSKRVGHVTVNAKDRTDFAKKLKKWNSVSGFLKQVDKTKNPQEYLKANTDRSSLVYAIYASYIDNLWDIFSDKAFGKTIPDFNKLGDAFLKHGSTGRREKKKEYWFTVDTNSATVNDENNYKLGDILVNKSNGLVAMIVYIEGESKEEPVISETVTSNPQESTSEQVVKTNEQTNIPNVSNKVTQLSTSSNTKDKVFEMGDTRKQAFEALRNNLVQNAAQMGREIRTTNELYDSNILKSGQEAKKVVV